MYTACCYMVWYISILYVCYSQFHTVLYMCMLMSVQCMCELLLCTGTCKVLRYT